eukprot:1984488-Rhodomonas_salina.2
MQWTMRYAMSGTELAYGAICLRNAMRCPVLSERMGVPVMWVSDKCPSAPLGNAVPRPSKPLTLDPKPP